MTSFGARVEVVLAETPSRFVSFGPDHDLWKGATTIDEALAGGAFARLKPPPGFPRSTARQVEEAFKAAGAVATRLDLPNEDEAVIGEVKAPLPPGSNEVRDERKTVEKMVEEARTTDREALRVEVERALGAAGL